MAGSSLVGGQNFGYDSAGLLLNRSVKLFELQPFGAGDTVGMGINFIKSELFFTANGALYPKVVQLVRLRDYFATVSLDSLATHLELNFGKAPFRFDFEGFFQLEVAAVLEAIVGCEADRSLVQKAVQDYLHRHALKKTYLAFSQHYGLALLDLDLRSAQPRPGEPGEPGDPGESEERRGEPGESEGDLAPQNRAARLALVPDQSYFPQRCAVRGQFAAGRFRAALRLLRAFFPKVANLDFVEALFLGHEFLHIFKRDRVEAALFAKSRFTSDKKHSLFHHFLPDRSLASSPLKVASA